MLGLTLYHASKKGPLEAKRFVQSTTTTELVTESGHGDYMDAAHFARKLYWWTKANVNKIYNECVYETINTED